MYNDELVLLENIADKFGIKFVNKNKKTNTSRTREESFVAPTYDDGALITGYGHFNNSAVDFNSSANVQSKSALIDTYRRLSQSSYIDIAVEEIVNETIIYDDEESAVEINLDDVDLSNSAKDKIRQEFKTIYKMFDFKNKGHDIFKRWFVDGNIHFHMLVDTAKLKDGIKEFRYVDPKKIQLIRERKPELSSNTKFYRQNDFDEYFIYSDQPFDGSPSGVVNGLKIEKDSMVYVTSGNIDYSTNNVLSYLHKAIRPHNLLLNMENATVVFKMARAPEKRAFYIDVTGIPGSQVPKYMQQLISKVKNTLEFNQETGEIEADARFTSMLQDYYLPQRDGKGTSIDTVAGSTGFDNMEPVDYFKDKLQNSLNVPKSRYETDSGFSLGREGDITREEVRFSKFISRVRNQFSQLFSQSLGFQLKVKKMFTSDEWDKFKQDIRFDFRQDNYFSELTETEIWMKRSEAASNFETSVEKGIVSQEWVNRKIWKFTDQDRKIIDKEVKKARSKGELPEAGSSYGLGSDIESENEDNLEDSPSSGENVKGDIPDDDI